MTASAPVPGPAASSAGAAASAGVPAPAGAVPPRGSDRRLGRPFWWLWAASTVSNLGDGVRLVALPWLASTLTRNPFLIAGLTLATSLPWLLFSLHAGAIIDRGDRRRIMMTMNLLRGGVASMVFVAVATDLVSLPLLYGAALVLGCAEVLFDNASQAILPRLVGPQQLERANGSVWGAQLVMNDFVGKPVGGALIGLALAAPFLFDAAVSLLAVGLLVGVRGTFTSRPDDARHIPTRLRSEIAEGFAWLWRHHLLRVLALMLGVMNAVSAAATATLVLFAQETLGLDAGGFGLLLAAGAIGGVLGSQVAASASRRLGQGRSLAVAVGALGLSLAVVGLTSHALVAGAAFAFSGFFVMLWNVITVSLRQAIIPDRLMGRVNSVYRFFGWGMIPLGTALGGGLVAGLERLAGRDLALRAPFIVAAAVHGLLLLVALRHIGTARIAAARTDAAA